MSPATATHADLRIRSAARAVILDPDRRILLVRWDFPDRPELGYPPMSVWGTPGGGIEPDEDIDAALRRELAEELGLDDVVDRPADLGAGRTSSRSSTGGGTVSTTASSSSDVEPFEPAPRLTVEQLRAEHLMHIRWWTQDELAAFVPDGDGAVRPRQLPAARRRAAHRRRARLADRDRGVAAMALDADASTIRRPARRRRRRPFGRRGAPHRDVARAVLRPVLRRRRRPGVVRAAPPHRRAPLRRRSDRVRGGLLRDLVGVGQLRLVRQRPRLRRRPVPPAHPRADRRRARPRRRHPRRHGRLQLHDDDDRLRRDAPRDRRDVAARRPRPAEPIDDERCAS